MISEYAQHSSAADNNKQVILEHLKEIFCKKGILLEIGSGSGQHAVFFSNALPHITWQASDRGEYLDSLLKNLVLHAGENVLKPIRLDVGDADWPVRSVDYIYAANVLHIMAKHQVPEFFAGAGKVINPDGILCLYGPYKYQGKFTTESNERFDEWLKARDPASEVRGFEWVCELALSNGLQCMDDFSMPANNQLLVFKKMGSE